MANDDHRIAAFIAGWKGEFGEELSEGQARIELQKLGELYLLLSKPHPEEGKKTEE